MEAACRAFAERGFRGTTIAAICRAAKANIAAVNYYFGSKIRLYEAVWEHAVARADEIYGPDDPGKNPGERLRERIQELVLMIFDEGPGGWFPRLIRGNVEMGGELAERLRTRFLLPRRRKMQEVIGEILEIDPESFEVRCMTGHILSMCIFLNIKMNFRRHIFGEEKPSRRDIDLLIRSMQEFAEGGLNRIRTILDSGSTAPGSPVGEDTE